MLAFERRPVRLGPEGGQRAAVHAAPGAVGGVFGGRLVQLVVLPVHQGLGVAIWRETGLGVAALEETLHISVR